MFFDIVFFLYGSIVLLALFAFLYHPKKAKTKATNVEFVIPTVADYRTRAVLEETINNLKRTFSFKINILVDEGSTFTSDTCNVITVPSSFEGKPCKGRALEYFRRFHLKPNTWYCILDDDSYPLDDSFLYEIPHYESRGYVVANGIIVPRKGKSKLTYVLDHIRTSDDLLFYRLTTGLLKKTYLGLHGEFLLVHSSVLEKISFLVDSLTEDFNFAQKSLAAGYKSWQSNTRICIKSPNSLRDFWRQRARWLKGIIKELESSRNFLSIFFAFSRMILGLSASSLFLPLWFLFPTHSFVAYFGFAGTLYYLSSYLFGIYHSRDWKMLLLLPILGIFEPLCLFYVTRIKSFEVIDKT